MDWFQWMAYAFNALALMIGLHFTWKARKAHLAVAKLEYDTILLSSKFNHDMQKELEWIQKKHKQVEYFFNLESRRN